MTSTTSKRSRSQLDSSKDQGNINKRRRTVDQSQGKSSFSSSSCSCSSSSFRSRSSSDNSFVTAGPDSPKGVKRKADEDTGKPKDKRLKVSVSTQAVQKSLSDHQESFCSQSIPNIETSRADFKEKYEQLQILGTGGFGCVYAGLRRADSLPLQKIPQEVELMKKAVGQQPFGTSAAVSLLDWYSMEDELIIVMERPDPAVTLSAYLKGQGGALKEDVAKDFMRQMISAAIDMDDRGVFHRDIKTANILVENPSGVPRLRIIDFGCSTSEMEKTLLSYNGTITLAPPEYHTHTEYKARPTTVWQLGGLLYRMMHGLPFNTMHFISGHAQLCKRLPRGCLDFLYQSLTINPEERATLRQLQLHPWLKPSQPSV
uniref:serine/threonine-protein kinase pim-1-like n=1 Tax=Semicossyphus pulcher TaxID=241346 RepID=UPI0037E80743